jgi:outer membrane protein TolC
MKLVTGYDQQFRVGRRSLLDLLTIQDNLYSYETQATNAKFEVLIVRARIQAVISRLAMSYQASSNNQAVQPNGLAQNSDSPRYRIQSPEPGN